MFDCAFSSHGIGLFEIVCPYLAFGVQSCGSVVPPTNFMSHIGDYANPRTKVGWGGDSFSNPRRNCRYIWWPPLLIPPYQMYNQLDDGIYLEPNFVKRLDAAR